MDEGLSDAVKDVFIRLYNDDLIYKGEYIVNWCPKDKTALADDEIEHEEVTGKIWQIKYPVKDSDESLTIATTRPETMLGDTGVAVNPNDSRYKHLIGKSVILPLMNREIPIVADEYVDMEYYPLYRFGFGLSYTSFEYSNLKIQEKANGNVEVQATVKNVGSRAGDEVAQLYVTDMYASVKTRVMELKDFARIHLQPGESKTVSFEMTPYDISLLNDRMDRVVEKGEFKIMVGGMSPDYVAKNEIKHSVGYSDNKKGVMGMLNYTHEFGANFDLTVSKIEENLVKNQKTVWVSVKNTGTLMDIGKVEMFVDGKKAGDVVHYELAPGEEKLIPFNLNKDNDKSVAFTTKYKMLPI